MEELILQQFGEDFKRLKTRIDADIANGKTIYTPRRQLGHYDMLRKLIKKIRTSINPTFSKVDAYRICGFNFDAEYNEYADFIRDLSIYADENNYVDQIKKLKGSYSLRTRLKKLSTDIKCSSADYLVLMTKYRYKSVLVSTDYETQLRKELHETYPNGDIVNIRRENPQLYEKLRHFCKYHPELGYNMQAIAEYFGLTNDRLSSNSVYQNLHEHELIKKIRALYPDGNINSLSKEHSELYYRIAKCAASHGLSISEWADKHDFKYTISINVAKLSKTKVDASEREQLLLKLQQKYMEQYPPTYTNEREEFHYKKKIAQLVVNELNKVSTM